MSTDTNLDKSMSSEDISRDIINQLRIASPCPMLWENMARTPEEAVRFCGDCRKNVYDVSKMSTVDANLLLQKASLSGSTPCMQLYRRADGTVITDDCPVGLKRIRDQWRKVKGAVAAAFALMVGALPAQAQQAEATRGRVVVKAERGEPVAPHTGGMVAPVVNVPLGGAPGVCNFRDMAMKSPKVKALADKIAARGTEGGSTPAEKLATYRMRLEMAQAANANNVPAFALDELTAVKGELQNMTVGGDKSIEADRKVVLKETIKTLMAVNKKLNMPNNKVLQAELNKL